MKGVFHPLFFSFFKKPNALAVAEQILSADD